MIKISILSPSARHNEACEHGGRALCRIVHLFIWHNSTTRTFSAILIPQNTLFRNSAICISQSTPSLSLWLFTNWPQSSMTIKTTNNCSVNNRHHVFTSAKEVMFLPVFVCLFVCLFVCVLARELKKLFTDLSEILRECRAWHKLPVIKFSGWSGKNPGFWITLKFSLPLR